MKFISICLLSILSFFGVIFCQNCIDSYPYIESFENSFGWEQDSTDQLSWEEDTINPNNYISYAPYNVYDGSTFLLVKNDTSGSGTANMFSPCFDMTSLSKPELSFAYHVYDENGDDTLLIYVSTDNGTAWEKIIWGYHTNVNGAVPDSWRLAKIDLSDYENDTVMFKITAILSTGILITRTIGVDYFSVQEFSGSSPGCNTIVSSFPYTESFETGFTDWEQDFNDDFNWSLLQYFSMSSFDGSYMMVADYNNFSFQVKQKGNLISPCFDITKLIDPELTFYYYKTETLDSIKVKISTNGGETFSETIWLINDHQGGCWNKAIIDLSKYKTDTIKVLFTAIAGASYGNLAIDKIQIDEASGIFLGYDNLIDTFPYQENFEQCYNGWQQSMSDDLNWLMGSVGQAYFFGIIPDTAYRGQNFLHTPFYYPYSYSNTFSDLISLPFDFNNLSHPEMHFHYSMFGNNIDSLQVQISTDGGKKWNTNDWSLNKNQGLGWHEAIVDLGNYAGDTVLIKFRGTQFAGTDSNNIAIDDIHVGQRGSIHINPIDLGMDIKLCLGEQDTLTTNVKAISYVWSTGETDSTIYVNSSGIYSVEVTFDSVGHVSLDTIVVNIEDTLVIDTIYVQYSTANSLTIIVISKGIAEGFYLELGDDITASGNPKYNTIYVSDTTLLVNYDSLGNNLYQITATYTNDSLDTLNTYMFIGDSCTYLEWNDTIIVSEYTSIFNQKKLVADVFPNPFSENLTFVFNPGIQGKVKIEIYDINGKLIAHEYIMGVDRNHILRLPSIKCGLYFYRVHIENKGVEEGIIISE